jgi:predicted GNAT family N-acyltransferase
MKPSKLKFKFIRTVDPEYAKELMLRWEVWGKSQGCPPEKDIDLQEQQSLHFIALEKGNVVGCVLFHQEAPEKGKIYQMAISEEYHGQGFGRKLLGALEKMLEKRGIKEVHLQAESDVIGFYSQMGYHPEGSCITEQGVLYQPMRKSIKPLA